MLLTVNTTPDEFSANDFTFTVPGDQRWNLRSVVATVSTDVGGQPGRDYILQITDGTNIVAQVGNSDGGIEPAFGTLTWANAPAATSSAGNQFSSIAPIPTLILNPGYTVYGSIFGQAPLDAFITAAVWYEFVATSPA